jgi:hypothetical protein
VAEAVDGHGGTWPGPQLGHAGLQVGEPCAPRRDGLKGVAGDLLIAAAISLLFGSASRPATHF